MKIISLALILLISINSLASQELCQFLYKQKELSKFQLARRQQIISKNHQLEMDTLLAVMEQKGSLVYKGQHQYKSGSQYIASNVFDWQKTPKDYVPTDLIIGFGTNSVWDIAARKRAKKMIVADWNPWPLIGQAYLMAPLLKVASTAEEFVVMLYGLPKSQAWGKSLEQVFDLGKKLNLVSPTGRRENIEKLLFELANNSRVNELELKFLTTFFRARFSENQLNDQYGPFKDLKDPLIGQVFYFFNKRYHPQFNSGVDSVLSDRTQYQYLREHFAAHKVQYALTSIDDFNFYKSVFKALPSIEGYTLSISNIFDSEYNGFSQSDLRKYLATLNELSGKPFTVFGTTNNQMPHNYYRYEFSQ